MNLNFKPQVKIPATFMRGGTSKGVFFRNDDLPLEAQVPGKYRDSFLLRVIGSPDLFNKQIDGMGGASSSTSKVVILTKSTLKNHDINFLFGQVSIDKPFIDWSGNCGNLSAAVGPFALLKNMINKDKIPDNGVIKVRIWQKNISKSIISYVPIKNKVIQEVGSFMLDGVSFPSAEIKLEFLNPLDTIEGIKENLFPTGKLIDEILIPGFRKIKATLINVGIPTVFINAKSLGLKGTEGQEDINSNYNSLELLEKIRAFGALKMGLIKKIEEASFRQHTPKIAFVSESKNYVSSSGKKIFKDEIDLLVRGISMGKLHHAMMGTAAIAIAVASAIPGTVVSDISRSNKNDHVTFGHPSGKLSVGAKLEITQNKWVVSKVTMSRSARIIMDGFVFVPEININH